MSLSIDTTSPYSIIVSGNTLPYKEEFKKYGGTWNGTLKAWRFATAKTVEITELVNKINSLKVSSTVPKYESYNNQQVKTPNIGDIVTISLNQLKLQVKVLSIVDNIMEMQMVDNSQKSTNFEEGIDMQKLYATIILGKWRIYDHTMNNEITF
jgi:hypothetical protein